MQIYFLSSQPEKCISALDTVRLNKAILEAAQIMSTALSFYMPYTDDRLYRPTHQHHPITLWVSNTSLNYMWCLKYFEALLGEYYKRRNRIHACDKLVTVFYELSNYIPHGDLQEFPNCARNKTLNLDFTHLPVHEAYEAYLAERQKLDRQKKEEKKNAPTQNETNAQAS